MRMCGFLNDIISFQGVNVEQSYEGGLCPLKIYDFFLIYRAPVPKIDYTEVKKRHILM